MNLQITPIYGWGWSDSKGDVVTVPSPFELEVEVIEAGQPFYSALVRLTAPDHPLTRFWILLAQRHAQNDGDYNLLAFSEKPNIRDVTHNFPLKPLIIGFASAKVFSN